MANGLIKSDQISASSENDTAGPARSARFFSPKGWIPHDSDKNPWLQIDLIIITKLTMIETQGQGPSASDRRLVKNYTLAYTIKAGTIFDDYKDRSGKVKVSSYTGCVKKITFLHALYSLVKTDLKVSSHRICHAYKKTRPFKVAAI